MKWYLRFVLLATFGTLLLVFVGGLVRVSGAGLGCPDWPLCFGVLLPPTSEAQLNARVQAARQLPDPPAWTSLPAAEFTVALTWIEYLNRLAGVLVGFFILGALSCAWRARRELPGGWYLMLAITVLLFGQAWLGGMVVQSRLQPLLVSAHFALAIVLLSLLLWQSLMVWRRQRWDATPEPPPDADDAPEDTVVERTDGRSLRPLVTGLWLLVVVQVGLGTQFRGALEVLGNELPLVSDRTLFGLVGWERPAHIGLGIAALAVGTGLWWQLAQRRDELNPLPRYLGQAAVILLFVQAAGGFAFRHFGLAPLLQVYHLWGAAAIAGLLLLHHQLLELPRPDELLPPRTLRLGAVAALGVIVASGVITLATVRAAEASRNRVPPPVAEVPAFTLEDSAGGTFSREDLLGKVTVLSWMFARCPGVCPPMQGQQARLYERYRHAEAPLQFVSITVDPAHDTADVLRDYATGKGVDDDRWRFLRGELAPTKALARACLVPFENPPDHSPRFLLIDRSGAIRGYYMYNDPDQLAHLEQHLEALARHPGQATP